MWLFKNLDSSNDKFALNGKKYQLDEFSELFKSAHEISLKSNKQYNIHLKVSKGVTMGTLHEIKIEFSKVKDSIREIIYSHEG